MKQHKITNDQKMLKPALGIIFLHPVFLMFILLIFSNLLSFLAISYFKINSESSEKVILDILLMSYAFLLGFLFKKSEPDEAQSQAEKESTQIYSALFYSLILQSTIFLYLYIFFSENCFIRFSVLNNALWLLFINLVICKKSTKIFMGREKNKKATPISLVLIFYGLAIILFTILHNWLGLI